MDECGTHTLKGYYVGGLSGLRRSEDQGICALLQGAQN